MANQYSVVLGGDNAFSATDHADFKPTGNFTVGGWIKTTGNTETIFGSFSVNTNVAGITLDVKTTTHKARLTSGRNTGTSIGTDFQEVVSSTSVDDGAWHFVVGTWDGSDLIIYVDGSLDCTPVSWANAPGYNATNYVRVGCHSNSGTNINFFSGNIDEVFLINGTAWDASTVTSYYNNSITGAANLKAYYQFENNGDDSSGQSHTLSNIGTPTYTSDVPFVGLNDAYSFFM